MFKNGITYKVCFLYAACHIHGVYSRYGTYTFNLMGKPTAQSSVYMLGTLDGTSDRVVDGNTANRYESDSCAHTYNDDETWWAVDTEAVVNVFSLTITNWERDCCHQRLNQFLIYGSNTTFNPFHDDNKVICYSFSGVFGNGATRTFNCTEPVIARFLSIALPRKEYLILCEVQMKAVCPDGTYGDNCTGTCSQHCTNLPCDKFTEHGTCPVGATGKCESGYRGDNCSIDCPVGTYGDQCIESCSPNCKNSCHQRTGVCNDGCRGGYTGNMCLQECDYSTYGTDCTPCSANCEFLPCDKETGGCPNGKCVPGFVGFNCTQECPSGRYGLKCLSECFPNCKGSCHYVDGSCRAGCEEGWTGEKCYIKYQQSTDQSSLVIELAIPLTELVVFCITLVAVLILQRSRKI